MSDSLRTTDFDYTLPAELIAQAPVPERDRSRLLVLDRTTGALQDRIFRDLPDYLVPGDVLVVNEAKVIPARLFGRSERQQGIEVLLLREMEADPGSDRAGTGCWEALIKPSRRIRVGDRLVLAEDTITAEVIEKRGEGRHLLKLAFHGRLIDLLWRIGQMPVPPYIKRRPATGDRRPSAQAEALLDRERYQTVYAKHEGAIAAPTAGLHFTPGLIAMLTQRGIVVMPITLFVGPGTFRPVRTGQVAQHRMEAERYIVPEQTALAVKTARREGRRVIAVGTTTVRALEYAASMGEIRAGAGLTDLFIYPGYRFQCIDGLITNFHLPRSTLLMLVSAFGGRETMLAAYRQAVGLRYRFYSYGDAMLIV